MAVGGAIACCPRRTRARSRSAENFGIIQNRWFDAVTGRWLSQDPSGLSPDSNPYRYCGNGPTNGVDPTGRFMWVAAGVGTVAAIGGGLYLVDWGTHGLSTAQQSTVNGTIQMLKAAARELGDNEMLRNLEAMTVTAQFNNNKFDPDPDGPSISQTRRGRLCGLNGTRSILSAEFFETNIERQLRTLLHESYHAGTGDLTETENRAEGYAAGKLGRVTGTRAYQEFMALPVAAAPLTVPPEAVQPPPPAPTPPSSGEDRETQRWIDAMKGGRWGH